MDTIPIQELVDAVESRSVDVVTQIIILEIASATGPLSGVLAIAMNYLAKPLIKLIVTYIVKILDRVGFNLNMDLVTSDQAKDYREAEANLIKAKANSELSDEEWSRLEEAANHKFDQLFNLTH